MLMVFYAYNNSEEDGFFSEPKFQNPEQGSACLLASRTTNTDQKQSFVCLFLCNRGGNTFLELMR